jgi:hypothetical protein
MSCHRCPHRGCMVFAPLTRVLTSRDGGIPPGCKIGAEQDPRPFPCKCRYAEQGDPVVLQYTAEDAVALALTSSGVKT